jgi:putative transposase
MRMEFFHILNRGVEKRDIVLDDGDRMRFIRSMFILNDTNTAPNAITQKGRREDQTKRRSLLVKIHAFCLMPNHYHMLVSPIGDNEENLSKFMQKFNMAHAKFFNEKYERTGVLWQGVFKKIHIQRDSHFLHIPYYIHLNPLDLYMPEWREGKIKNTKKALECLREYRWSSHLDYIGKQNFPSIISREELSPLLGKKSGYEKKIANIITSERLAAKSNILE